MPAPPLTNNFNGGVNGNTIATTDTGSGDKWSTVFIGTSGACTYDNTHAHSGTLGMKIVEPVTAVAIRPDWTGLGTITTDVWTRIYVYITANPGASWQGCIGYRTNAAAASSQVGITTGGLIACTNAAGATITALNGTVALALNQWVRIEARCVASTTVGQLEWRLFNNADSTTVTETLSASSLVLGADTGQIRWGLVTTPAPASYTAWFDDIAINSTGWLGPALPDVKLNAFSPVPFIPQGRNL